ncbi:type VI secretion system baseplate subunit TssG [Limibaculum sp. FT325]|uniref:type VI secretion system baseplate subunit TssG n=1 Tax=Thermohalobaculum sediminis TaxID=2939436 RepID=UPI0020BF01A9|nr:type VI secretion system baseplate subunit TssG [Limibaculum sediminis]MCL5777303.1 type VI secretion system baseplate subunit TssG [Limibaculum sediminis]
MAGDERAAAPDLSRLAALGSDPQSHHIFQALRLIEAAFPDRPRLGRSRRPAQDPVRIGQEAELAFPPSTISAFAPPAGDAPGRLVNRFFGLFGPNGPLPLHLTEYARDRQRNVHDHTLVAFANLFHHRMTSLLYRAWAAGEPAPSFDRPDDDPFAAKVAAISGRMGRGMEDRDAMPDLAKLHFAALLGQGPKNAEGLLAIVSAFFAAPARIEGFVGTWLHLEPHDRWRLGEAPLGRGTSLGARVWSRQSKFRIRLGPVGFDAYSRLLPGGQSLKRLAAIVRNYLGDTLEWEANLVLKADEVPRMRLGHQGRLGWTTWLGERAPGRDADDLRLLPPSRHAF